VFTVCLGVMMALVNVSPTISALGAIQQDLHPSADAPVWITSAYSPAVASLVLSAGTLADLVGRRAVLLAGAAVFVIGSLTAFAGRLIRRVGFTVMPATGLALMGAGALALLAAGSGTGYGALWPGLLIAGVGSALLGTAPSAAAAVNSVPRLRAGMASSSVNCSASSVRCPVPASWEPASPPGSRTTCGSG
jgi:MFS family permease